MRSRLPLRHGTLTQPIRGPPRVKKHRGAAPMSRCTLLAALTSVAVLSIAAGAVVQTPDDFPNRPIRIIVPQAAGSGVDLQARALPPTMGALSRHQALV